MTEILYFEIPSLYKDGQLLPNTSCTFILGTESIDSPIPTTAPIKIQTNRLDDTESLLILFKYNDDIVAKTTTSLWTLRNGISLESHLETLNSTGAHSNEGNYSWENSYRILSEDNAKIESFTKNPFESQALHLGSPLKEYENLGGVNTLVTLGGFNNSSANMDYGGDQKGKASTYEDYLKIQESNLITNSAEQYLNNLKTSIAREDKEVVALSAEMKHLLTDLKASVQEMEQRPVDMQALLSSGKKCEESGEDSSSPQFGKGRIPYDDSSPTQGLIHEGSFSNRKQVNYQQTTSPIRDINTWAVHEETKENTGEHRSGIKVHEVEEEYQNREDDNGEDDILQHLEGQEGDEDDEEQGPKIDTLGSLQEELKIDRNQDFLLEIKNQLGIKSLSHVNDAFTRELVMQMSRSKKKICAIRIKKAVKLRTKITVDVDQKSYFRDSGDKKYLHYFQPYTKYLYLFNLAKPFNVIDEKPVQVTLDIDFDISPHYKSVITPSGLIFIVSGKTQVSAPNLDDSTGSLHVYHYNGQTLIEKPEMSASRRKNFGLCYMSKNLFVVGGIVDGILSNYCERFDIRSNEWMELAPMNKKLKDISICSFNSRYIYRYFGINAMNMIDSSIERYDAVRDKWTIMNVVVPELLREVHMPLCTQINEGNIFIFGGRTSSGYPSKSNKGFVMRIEDKRRSNNAEIVQTMSFVSGLAGGFNQNSIIAHEGDILFIRESY